jgi:hypothetical protein
VGEDEVHATDAPGAAERREHVRRMLRVPATLGDGPDHATVQLIDICRAGVAFASAEPLELGSTFTLTFHMPTCVTPCLVSGDVVYCRLMPQSGKYKVGARLHPPSEEVVEAIVDFVTSPYIA